MSEPSYIRDSCEMKKLAFDTNYDLFKRSEDVKKVFHKIKEGASYGNYFLKSSEKEHTALYTAIWCFRDVWQSLGYKVEIKELEVTISWGDDKS